MRSIFVSVRQGKLAKWQNDFLNEAMRWIFAVMIVLSFIVIIINENNEVPYDGATSARPEGQLISDGAAYSPFRSILLVLTHDFIITCVYGQ